MTKLLSTFWFLSSNTQTDDEYEERNRRGTQRHTDTYTEKSDKTRTVAAKHYYTMIYEGAGSIREVLAALCCID